MWLATTNREGTAAGQGREADGSWIRGFGSGDGSDSGNISEVENPQNSVTLWGYSAGGEDLRKMEVSTLTGWPVSTAAGCSGRAASPTALTSGTHTAHLRVAKRDCKSPHYKKQNCS